MSELKALIEAANAVNNFKKDFDGITSIVIESTDATKDNMTTINTTLTAIEQSLDLIAKQNNAILKAITENNKTTDEFYGNWLQSNHENEENFYETIRRIDDISKMLGVNLDKEHYTVGKSLSDIYCNLLAVWYHVENMLDIKYTEEFENDERRMRFSSYQKSEKQKKIEVLKQELFNLTNTEA